jgi:endonuclease/exonuclease/phosphatase family metal-dependent hydrolase
MVGLGLLVLLSAACETRKPTSAPTTQPGETAKAWTSAKPTGTFLDRDPRADLRLVCYNIKWNSIFPEVDAARAAKFARVVRSLDPDILALQEVGLEPRQRGQPGARKWTGRDVQTLMNRIVPPPGGSTWHTFQGSDNVIVSRYPLKMTADRMVPAGERELAMALVDLPDERFAVDVYVLSNHYKCCDPERFDVLRQQQSDAIVSWIRDARTPGGELDLPAGTPILVVGDLNIVGSRQPVDTLLTGDIIDEQKHGPDFPPDWDDTGMTDAHPLHNIDGPDDYTWRDDTSQFTPGRLDYVIYTDSVLEPVKKFVLNTTTLSEEVLHAAGLQEFDITVDDVGREYDHLPLVVDFRVKAGGEDTPDR